jgi:hypothetical protein
MWGWRRWLDQIRGIRERRRLRKRVDRALRVLPRGGCADDRLIVKCISVGLRVEWWARDVHPWDRDLPVDERDELFLELCRRDTVDAVQRIFARLAEVDEIEIRVVQPDAAARTTLAGTVSRHDVNVVTSHPSPGMSLMLMGIRPNAEDNA